MENPPNGESAGPYASKESTPDTLLCFVEPRHRGKSQTLLPENQMRFKIRRSSNDSIYILKQFQKIVEYKDCPFFVDFLGRSNDFESVNRSRLLKVSENIGCPSLILSLTASIHEDMKINILMQVDLIVLGSRVV